MSLPPNTRKDFDIAIICALQVEADAVEALFDHFWEEDGDRYGKSRGDQNAYRTGVIGNHNVVLAYMPGIGKAHAASVASSFRSSFQGIRLALIVGICGGVPDGTSSRIFLGDIIISDEIVIYDLGRIYPGGFRRKEGITNSTVNIEVRTFLQKLKSQKGREHLLKQTTHHFTRLQKRVSGYSCPGITRDRLFENTYHHKHQRPLRCEECEKGELCEKAQEATCEALKCDQKKLVARPISCPDRPDIHFGRMASGDKVMKSGLERDKIAQAEEVVAFEMEGAGVCHALPFVLVKGVCDYADSHKDKHWQKYTAGRAAACMRSLLEQWAIVDSAEESTERYKEPSQEHYYNLDTRSEMTSPRPPPIDEGNSSPRSHDTTYGDLLQFLPAVKFGFKSALACFKVNRKHLPRDADLRSLLKTQRVIFLEILEDISSNTSEYAVHERILSNKLHLDGAQAIRTKLEEIEDITNSLPVAKKEESQSRSDVDNLKNAVEDLASLVHVFVSLMPQPKKPRSIENSKVFMSSRSCREFQHFQIVQQAACSLYDAFGTACNAHTVHNVHLSLQPDLDQTLSRVQFNVAYSQISMTSGKAIWIKVESKIKSPEVNPEVNPESTSLLIQGEIRSLKRSVHFEDSPSEVRKEVRSQTSGESIRSLCPKESFSGVPNLHLQRNLCTLMERFSHQRECNRCIGLLGDNVICTHLAYMHNQPDDKSTSTSLSQLISLSRTELTECMSLYEQIRLCRYLATAVLYYHATPWLTKAWRSEDIHFFGHGSSLRQMPHNLLYIAMATSVQVPEPPNNTQPPSLHYHHVVRNPVLFGLGVMFLEIAYEAPLEVLQQPVDIDKDGLQGFADYFTAHRVAESGRKVTGNFKAIIEKMPKLRLWPRQ
ncbi:uncharacterized protein N7503_001518 [Penicillium pulvis]|uniref:uncharacterized protein n=1 Tax=Penicillium pulvis TaxID=1562058 RepID=UPI002548778C|nr:uncharacterized protein N7503_001518 [Penicillium pulvis]KAJ5809300.1 hypothetical protein N7503_001518 [Penicillium pulvis]